MKYNIIIGIVFLVCLFVFLPTVQAESGKMFKVESAATELREAPAQEAAVVTELTKDDKITVFQDSDGWGATFYNGDKVWVALDQLAEVNDIKEEKKEAAEQDVQPAVSEIDTESSALAKNGQLYHVKAPVVNVRNAPNQNAEIIAQLNKDDKVTIFQDSYGWGKTYYNGKEVWIALYLLDKDSESADSKKSEEIETTVAAPETVEENKQEETETTADPKNDEKTETDVESKHKEEKQTATTKQNSEKPFAGYHFVIDPGHGGKDPGAIGSETNEKTLTLSTAKKLSEQLKNKGASVTLTRTDDTYISLEKRANISNSADTDAFISLHYNSSAQKEARGIETYYYDGGESKQLADSVQASLIDHTDLHNRGAKQADFHVLKGNKQLALLVELGFISNPEEQKLVQSESYQEKAITGIVAGLEDYFT
ncbi:N-acetylmuramoyl-L-alanine amidase [Gracilibacillus alcaliphilus]|uniref:N-acetylmuramoyl-L-alanine amidase n=1 Tax=Gracilibacillus alcaliphilus TaxID=1401441 RepID=UPI00195B1706|nr:N-acetylmuramoyl-L-alanine amidase [Gracilibacillus alcaliphilus]MBM7675326.1 N-acetylmuramoyl-L-alanine amidase [Gracilibacillus alcaliphilus]